MVARWPTPPHAQACPDFCRLALRCKKISTSGYPSRRPAQVLRRMNLVVSRRVQRLMASLLAIQAAAPASIEHELSGSGISRRRTAALNAMDSLLKALQRAGSSPGFRGLKWGDSAAELAAVPIKCRMSHVLARSLALGQASRFSCRGERRGAGNTKGRAAAGNTALKNGCGGPQPTLSAALAAGGLRLETYACGKRGRSTAPARHFELDLND